MRYLGADPSCRADDIEALTMILLNNRIVSELRRGVSD